MKKLLIIALAIMFASGGNSQTRVTVLKELRDKSCKKTHAVFETVNQSLKTQDLKNNPDDYDAEAIGSTWYDLQSNASVQNRTYLYPDGYIGGAFTFGENYAAFADRGTGYNIFDNNDWGPWPVERIESVRCGWPSYAPWGPAGEIAVAHYSDGLVFSKRSTKGVGPWTEFYFTGPLGHNLLWPRMTTSGTNHETIHLIALTTPVANGGTIYQGQNGALVYSRSTNGGVSWDIENVIIDGIGSENYTGFEGDTYEFAYPRENTIALVIGNDWTDLILLKSTDNGDTWSKTLIWEHPYPLFDPNNMIVTDTFYCVDGAHSVAIDNTGKAHVAFGINRALCDGIQQFWFPLVDGIGYWNEDMPTFSTNLNALSPYDEPGTELVEDYNLIAWMQDMNGNGVLDILPDVGLYYLGTSSMPQLVTDDQSQVFLIYSSLTETYDNGIQNYRHIWARGSNNNGMSWGNFHDLNSGLIYIFDECVFPSCSPTSDENLLFTYQSDNEPGLAVRGDEDPFGENYIIYYTIDKSDIIFPVPGNTLTGVVSESEGGNPIQGATISLEGTPFLAISSAGGNFTISGIPAGSYTATCAKQGYIDETASVVIDDNYTTYQNFELAQVVFPDEEIIGNTFYDLQSNTSMQNRIYKYDDGTIGAAWTFELIIQHFWPWHGL
ncbi:MAG: carboxypeptidase regulatory-like domain-containing protein [Bacteroidales bacterium]